MIALVALPMDETFQRLEDKLSKAVEVFKKALADKRALEQEVERLRADARERAQRAEVEERELIALRKERDDVRNRVERLLAQVENLTKPESAA